MKTKTTANNSLKTVLGPLWKFHTDSSVHTICVDAFDDAYIFQGAESKTAPKLFKSPRELDQLVVKLIRFSGKKIDEATKTYSFNIDDYTRVTIALPPIAIKGPSIVMNKIPQKEVTFNDLVHFNALDEEGKKLILDCIAKGKGILVAGNPGSGKTTLLNTIINAIPQFKRIVTIERYADLVVKRQRVCRLQTMNQKSEELADLVEIAERLFADYLAIANFEGPEVMPFMEVVRSNNTSALGLISGENPLDALKRLETKAVLSSEGMSLEDARYAISQSFQHIIFQEKRDERRLVSSIAEIRYEGGDLKLKVIYNR